MQYQIKENCLTIFLPAEVDHHNAEEIKREADKVIEEQHIKYVIFDFGRTNFMDSSGIGVIMGRYRHIFLLGGEVWAIHTSEKEYETYVKEKTPVRKPGPAMAKAFVTGGIICTIGQTILNACEKAGMSKDISASWCSLILILASVVLTGFGIYPKIANWGGAGALVPITGFANSVAAPAIEYKKEGQVFGIGCKIFTIAGPVILYGVFTSWVLGLLYWIGTLIGIV